YSGTNNQETGVDEADFVKTDGYSLFVLNGQKLVVFDVPEFGLLSDKAALDIEGRPGNMLLYKDNATGRATRGIIFSSLGSRDLEEDNPLLPFITDNVSDEWYYSVPSLTKITVVDLSSADSPQVLRELYLEGSYQTARLIKSAVHMVAYSWMDVPGLIYWPELPDSFYDLPDDNSMRQELWDAAVNDAISKNNALIDALSLADLIPAI
ncbi:MAG: hypothetical protein GY868_11280, partial [Deltaproteobacteria bacterium]|nr:hypothetical protein [Deltaproteobacteria bacterium]